MPSGKTFHQLPRADVGARHNCSVFLRKTFALGAGASSFPQNALRWRFVGALGNPHFEMDIVGATLRGRPFRNVNFAGLPQRQNTPYLARFS